MGKVYAPSLANLYLLDLDHQATTGYHISPLTYFRYLDDIFGVWPGTLTQLQEYCKWLSTVTPGIQITMTHHTQAIDFLDITVYKFHHLQTTKIHTKIFFKETATHQLLHTESFHPRHTAKGVLKSQLLRFKRISTSYADYQWACSILFSALTPRGYNIRQLNRTKEIIWPSLWKVPKNPTPSLPPPSPPPPPQTTFIPIVLPFSDLSVRLADGWKNIMKKYTILNNVRTIKAYSNHPNLRRKLVSSKLGPMTSSSPTNGSGTTHRATQTMDSTGDSETLAILHSLANDNESE